MSMSTPLPTQLRRWWSAHPAATEIVAGLVVAVAIAAVVAYQYGLTVDAWIRGASLGPWLGLAVGWSYRRRRTAAEREAVARQAQRLQLARELHDTVAGQVSVIGIQAAAARRVLASRPDDAAVALERIEAASRAANTDLRRMLDALRGDEAARTVAEPGLAQLDDLVATFGGDEAPVILAVGQGTLPVTDAAVDRAAYRIVQEALTNAVRHANGGKVEVRVMCRDDGLSLDIADSGGRRQNVSDGGFGIEGMRERAAVYGGRLEAGPRDDGFAVKAWLPASKV